MDRRLRCGRADCVLGLSLVSCWIAFAIGADAHAQSDATPPAMELAAVPGYAESIHEAVEHYTAHRWREAQAAFARAHALQPSARTYRGLGLAAFYLEEFAVARQAFEQALSDARRPLPEEQRREVVGLLAECARETGRFELRVAPASARVEVDRVVAEQRVLYLSRGEHAVSVSADGHVPQHATLIVTGGEDRALAFALPTVVAPALPAVAPPAPTPILASEPSSANPALVPANRERAGGGRVLTWIVAGTALVFAGTAAAVWFVGEGKRDDIEDDCARDRCDRADANRRIEDAGLAAHETWTTVSLAASGVALVAATVLFVVEGEKPQAVSIQIDAARSGAALRRQF